MDVPRLPKVSLVAGGAMADFANRNCLSVVSFEALKLLKSAYRNGHIAAADDAATS